MDQPETPSSKTNLEEAAKAYADASRALFEVSNAEYVCGYRYVEILEKRELARVQLCNAAMKAFPKVL